MDTLTFRVSEKTIQQRQQLIWMVMIGSSILAATVFWLQPEFRSILKEPAFLLRMLSIWVLALLAIYLAGQKLGIASLRQMEIRLTPDGWERQMWKNKEQFTYDQIKRLVIVKNRLGHIVQLQIKTTKTTLFLGGLENMELLVAVMNERINRSIEQHTRTALIDWNHPLFLAGLVVVVWIFFIPFFRTQEIKHILLLQLFIFLIQVGLTLFAKPVTRLLGKKFRFVEYLFALFVLGYCLFMVYFYWPELWQGPCGLPARYLEQSGCIEIFEAGNAVAFLPEERSLFIMPFEEYGDASTIELVPLGTQPVPAVTSWQHEEWLEGFSLSSNGKQLLTWGENHELWLWDVATGELILHRDPEGFERAVLAPDHRVLATTARNLLSLWDTDSWQLLTTIEQVRSVAFSPDGSLMATCPVGSENIIDLWRAEDFAFIRSLTFPNSQNELCWAITFSADGEYIAAAEYSREVYVWRVSDGEWLFTFAEPAEPSTPPAFSADGQMVAVGYAPTPVRNGYVKIWSVVDGSLLATVPPDGNVIYRPKSVAFSADGSLLAVANYDQVMVFEMAQLLP